MILTSWVLGKDLGFPQTSVGHTLRTTAPGKCGQIKITPFGEVDTCVCLQDSGEDHHCAAFIAFDCRKGMLLSPRNAAPPHVVRSKCSHYSGCNSQRPCPEQSPFQWFSQAWARDLSVASVP